MNENDNIMNPTETQNIQERFSAKIFVNEKKENCKNNYLFTEKYF